jgi:N-methylhydantoinase A
MTLRLGTDTGGTFTDFVWVNSAGELVVHKELSTPADPSQAILHGLAALAVPTSAAVVHGSTVATNALLERRGARTALITTQGFADVLAIARQNRPDLYALVPVKPPPLVPGDLRWEARERVASSGDVLLALDSAELATLTRLVREAGVESVAVCLLFSFLRPDHERQIRTALQADGSIAADIHVSLSSDILPEYREYERTAATVINAYVAPLMTRYLDRLAAGVAPRALTVMQSNGGIIGAGLAGQQAARTVLSGPAGGVVGAQAVAATAGLDGADEFHNLITFDMGGTSTDVALCPGRPPMTAESEIAGLPLRLPTIDIHTVGAGGGSLAYVVAGGALHVGPESAGADPGPACYHADYGAWRRRLDEVFPRGLATITDANLVLGRLDPDHFLGGTMRLHEASARAAVTALAQQIGAATPEAAAADVVRVTNATMERAVRRISVERGHDPRQFSLLAFGGGGPLHACDLAGALRIPRVLIPPVPGVLSALGMLVAAPSRDYSRTVMQRIAHGEALPREWLEAQFAALREQAAADLRADGYGPETITFHHQLDLRYLGQSHELTVDWEPGRPAESAIDAFHIAHEQRYSYRQTGAAVELVTIRLSGRVPQTFRIAPPAVSADSAPTPTQKTVWFNGQPVTAQLVSRAALRPLDRLDGPAVITQYDTTTLLPPGWAAQVDAAHNLILSHAART